MGARRGMPMAQHPHPRGVAREPGHGIPLYRCTAEGALIGRLVDLSAIRPAADRRLIDRSRVRDIEALASNMRYRPHSRLRDEP